MPCPARNATAVRYHPPVTYWTPEALPVAEKVHLNVAMIAGSMPPMPCGVGDNALQLGRALAERGHTVTIFTHLDAAPISEHNLTVRPIVNSWDWAGCHALTQALVFDDPDLVHIHYPTRGYGRRTGPGLLPMFLKIRRFKGPIVAHLHEYTQAHWLRRLAVWPLLNDADGVIIPGPEQRESILFKHRSLKDRPVQSIPVGPVVMPGEEPAASEAEWAAFLAAHGVPADAYPLILSYGFVRRDKGLEVLGAALAEMKKTSKAHVLHIGPWDPAADFEQEGVLNDLSNRLIIDRFHFAGYQPLHVLPATPPRGAVAVFPYRDGISDRRSAAITLGSLGWPILTTTPPDPKVAEIWAQQAQLVPANNPEALMTALKAIEASDTPPTGNAAAFAARYGWETLGNQVERFYDAVFERYRVLTDPGYYPAAAAAAMAGEGHGHGHH